MVRAIRHAKKALYTLRSDATMRECLCKTFAVCRGFDRWMLLSTAGPKGYQSQLESRNSGELSSRWVEAPRSCKQTQTRESLSRLHFHDVRYSDVANLLFYLHSAPYETPTLLFYFILILTHKFSQTPPLVPVWSLQATINRTRGLHSGRVQRFEASHTKPHHIFGLVRRFLNLFLCYFAGLHVSRIMSFGTPPPGKFTAPCHAWGFTTRRPHDYRCAPSLSASLKPPRLHNRAVLHHVVRSFCQFTSSHFGLLPRSLLIRQVSFTRRLALFWFAFLSICYLISEQHTPSLHGWGTPEPSPRRASRALMAYRVIDLLFFASHFFLSLLESFVVRFMIREGPQARHTRG